MDAPADMAPDVGGGGDAGDASADAQADLGPSEWSCQPPDGGVGGCTPSGLFDLGALPPRGLGTMQVSEAIDINDAGDILMAHKGASLTGQSTAYSAAVWVAKSGCWVLLGSPSGTLALQTGWLATALNARSSVAATAQLVNSTNDGAVCNGTCSGFTTSTTSMRIASTAIAINDADQVVGLEQDISVTLAPSVPYIWTRTAAGLSRQQLFGIGPPADINDAGQVVGGSVLWQAGTAQDLGTLGGTSTGAVAINASGRVIGYGSTADGSRHAFWWEAGVIHDLGTLGGAESSAVAINSSGQIAGNSNVAGGSVHAFFWDGTMMHDLGTLGGDASVVGVPTPFNTNWQTKIAPLVPTYKHAVNDAGQVVGTSVTAAGEVHGFVWQAGTMRDLGTLSGTDSNAAAINASGQVVGSSNGHGYVYAPGRCP